jgi:hypothetical protein
MGNKPMFIGEQHTNTEILINVAYKLMWIHDQVDAIYIEHYPNDTGPSSTKIKKIKTEMIENGMMGGSWVDSRPTLPTEIAQLKYQCHRYNIKLRGWDIPYKNNFQRALGWWNNRVIIRLWADLSKQVTHDPKRYIIYGGKAHGIIMKKSPQFTDLPLFEFNGNDFAEVIHFTL